MCHHARGQKSTASEFAVKFSKLVVDLIACRCAATKIINGLSSHFVVCLIACRGPATQSINGLTSNLAASLVAYFRPEVCGLDLQWQFRSIEVANEDSTPHSTLRKLATTNEFVKPFHSKHCHLSTCVFSCAQAHVGFSTSFLLLVS